jgi:spoIIIJ-associated protein
MNHETSLFSAPDVEQAIKQGLSKLGLARDQVEIEIVDEGRKGLFGIGTRDAVVRLKPIPPQSQAAPAPGTRTAPRPKPVAQNMAASSLAEAQEPAAGDRGQMPSGGQMPSEGYTLSETQVAETARQVLEELLAKMGIQAQVTIRRSVEFTGGEPIPIVLDVQGEDLEPLVGQQGKVLNALQHVTRLIVSREIQQWVDLVVDVERYKERRAQSLRKLAMHMAERVAHSAQPIALEPMPPNERREIHIALREHPAVTTQSVGRGDERRVTIIPKHR